MMEQWEEFSAGPNKPRNERLHVTLNAKGQILVNYRVYMGMGKPEAAVLLFDRLNSRIGIRPADATLPNAFPFKTCRGRGRLLSAGSFCTNYGIKVAGTVAFDVVRIDDKEMLTLDLTKSHNVSRITTKAA